MTKLHQYDDIIVSVHRCLWMIDDWSLLREGSGAPFYYHGLTLTPAWMSHHMPSNQLTIPAPLNLKNGWVISFNICIKDVITFPCWDLISMLVKGVDSIRLYELGNFQRRSFSGVLAVFRFIFICFMSFSNCWYATLQFYCFVHC